MPTYSIVVPIYRDGELAADLCQALQAEFSVVTGADRFSKEMEVIFVNDGSPNDSQRHLEELAARHSWVRVMELSRNFGQHVAISCGYQFASGRYIAMMDVDMQDPVDQLVPLFAALEQDRADIVIGQRTESVRGWREQMSSRIFHSLLNWLTGAQTPANLSTMRAVNRRFLNAYNQLTEKTPFIPGLQNWLGFRRLYLPIRHQERRKGKSSYTFFKRLRLATESIVSFSDLPLRIAAGAGTGIALIGLLMAAVLIAARLLYGTVAPGFAATMVVVIVLGGLNLIFMGLIGIYVGRILQEVQGRPRFVLKSSIGFGHLASSDEAEVLKQMTGERQTLL
jgi:glycosyltransferase involved in cell wall biosynthesis